MAQPNFLPVVEAPDGVRTDFSLPMAYAPGSFHFFINGQKQPKDCVDELDPSAGTARWLGPRPFKSNFVVEAWFIDPSIPDGVVRLCETVLVLQDRETINVVKTDSQLQTVLQDREALNSAIQPRTQLCLSVEPRETLKVVLRCS